MKELIKKILKESRETKWGDYKDRIVDDLIQKTIDTMVEDPDGDYFLSLPKEFDLVLNGYTQTIIKFLKDIDSENYHFIHNILPSLKTRYALRDGEPDYIWDAYRIRLLPYLQRILDNEEININESTKNYGHKYIEHIVNDLIKKTKFHVRADIDDPMSAIGFSFPDEFGIKVYSGTFNNNIEMLMRSNNIYYSTNDDVNAALKKYYATDSEQASEIIEIYKKRIIKKGYQMVDDFRSGRLPLTESTSKEDKFIDIVVKSMIKKTTFNENGKVIDYPFPHMKSQAMGIIYITSSVYEWISETYGVRGGLDPYYNIILPIYRKYEEEIKNLRSTD